MSLSEINWKRHLSPSSLVPPDFEIRVVEGSNLGDWVEGNELRAHKAFLASVSDVLAAQFYGSMALDQAHIYLENTTMTAARSLLDYIYGKPEELRLWVLSMENLYLLLLLADKFALLGLVRKVESAIGQFRVEKSNVMEVAAVAEKYSHVFGDLSEKVHVRCAGVLAVVMKDFASVSEFLLTKVEDLDLLKKLLRSQKTKKTYSAGTSSETKAMGFRFVSRKRSRLYDSDEFLD